MSNKLSMKKWLIVVHVSDVREGLLAVVRRLEWVEIGGNVLKLVQAVWARWLRDGPVREKDWTTRRPRAGGFQLTVPARNGLAQTAHTNSKTLTPISTHSRWLPAALPAHRSRAPQRAISSY